MQNNYQKRKGKMTAKKPKKPIKQGELEKNTVTTVKNKGIVTIVAETTELTVPSTVTGLATGLGMTVHHVRKLITAHSVPLLFRASNKSFYSLKDLVAAIAQDNHDKYSNSDGIEEPKNNRERLEKLKGDEQVLKNAILTSELVNKDEILQEFSAILTKVKTRFLTLPRPLSIRVMELLEKDKIEEHITNEIREILTELSDYNND